ncbi:MAG: D-tyrosyl-tRNA(Tyr) deacylase [candidate division Zixibacteria bacterium RBG_16_50_21]|nr:MAG: D-tyrosyl-tRNA(Tyr) deacylase [candidate division Zixibacteria bacterium RBG_16_50_21]
MKIVLQRVKQAAVLIEGKSVGEIGPGLLLLIGAKKNDHEKDAQYLAERIVNLRIFEDEHGKMNLSALETKAEILAVSQFTLYGDTNKGRRPGFDQALEPGSAKELYHKFVELLKGYGLKIQTGVFGAKMLVQIFNDGPVTFILES